MAEVLVGEAARILNISVNHVRYLERTGQLKARRIGHVRVFQQDEVEKLKEDRYRKATNQPTWQLGDPE